MIRLSSAGCPSYVCWAACICLSLHALCALPRCPAAAGCCSVVAQPLAACSFLLRQQPATPAAGMQQEQDRKPAPACMPAAPAACGKRRSAAAAAAGCPVPPPECRAASQPTHRARSVILLSLLAPSPAKQIAEVIPRATPPCLVAARRRAAAHAW